MKKLESPNGLYSLQEELIKERAKEKTRITVCNGSGCYAYNCNKLTGSFSEAVKKYGLEEKVEITAGGCHGFCERGTIVTIQPQQIFYQKIRPENAEEIIKETILGGKTLEKFQYADPNTKKIAAKESDIPFYKKQKRIVFENNGKINPTKIGDYLSIKGYSALAKAITMAPEEIVEEIKKSGLRGRGGAGFPTGQKWEQARKALSQKKYVICNADEGDPGAYMDRSLLEGNPHSIIEGMLIGAYAIGADEGFVYVRNEYPLAVKNLKKALSQAYELGILGENILGKNFSFKIKISRGGGAFVCGEETALIASIEGKPGEPRARPPYPSEKGLWGKPTNINNVETWANIPPIINNGSAWYSRIGTEKSKGTKIFSLVGKISNSGLVEVPMGITLKEIIFEIGGGVPNNKKFKAAQIGGPSGGCMPPTLLDTPVDYERLTEVGAMMGSGGLIVMDEDTCMVDIARYFTSFLKDESCGKCVSCREGTAQMNHLLTKICSGEGKEKDLKLLEELSEYTKSASLCGLGATAPNPVLTSMKYFKKEYEEHIKNKRCEAGVCKKLTTYYIDASACTSCGRCVKQCPKGIIMWEGNEKKTLKIMDEECDKCGICRGTCKDGAVKTR